MKPKTLKTIRDRLRYLKLQQAGHAEWKWGYREAIDAALYVIRKEVHNEARRNERLIAMRAGLEKKAMIVAMKDEGRHIRVDLQFDKEKKHERSATRPH